MRWEGINTAPMEGEFILVYYPLEGVSIASFFGGMWTDCDGDLYGPPTHWMPLPEAPK